jgi:sec-independent protein translocase protein TatA
MFGIGFPELMIILLIGFLVLGPEKAIALCRDLGRIFADFKKKAGQVEKAVLSELNKTGAEAHPKEKDDVQAAEEKKSS